MNRRGTIFTYSVVHSGTEAFKHKIPFIVAIVKENQQKRMARVEGYTEKTEITIGMEVEFLTEDEKGNAIYRFM
jgi:uncharacterized OB-fold protein